MCAFSQNGTFFQNGVFFQNVVFFQFFSSKWCWPYIWERGGTWLDQLVLVPGNSMSIHSTPCPFSTFPLKNKIFFKCLGKRKIWLQACNSSVNFVHSMITRFRNYNELEPRLKFAQNRFQLSTGLNLETLNTILSGTNLFWPGFQI